MLRQKDVKKYKKKSKYDQLLFLRKDGEYLLKNERPIKDNLIKTMNQKKVPDFIEDILVNKKITHLLFRSNSDFEINYYINTKNKFFTHKTPLIIKHKDNITLKQVKKQTCSEIKQRINIFKKDREEMVKSMDNINKKRIKIFKKDLKLLENLNKEDINNNKIKGFIRSYNSIKKKYDIINNKQNLYRNNSCILYNNNKNNKNRINLSKNKKIKINNNNRIIKSISEDTYESEIKSRKNNFSKIKYELNNNNNINKSISLLPNVKLDIKNVFSRLYNNAVLPEQKRPQSCKNKNRNNNQLLDDTNIASLNQKINFKLKKVIKSTSGKEFTFKITPDIIRRCFINYSGGPSILNMKFFKKRKEESKNYELNKQNQDEGEITKKKEGVNYYKLIQKKTGNSFLHLAVIGGYYDFVRYFLEKKSNINMKNKEGNTPLHLALYNKKKNKKIIDILMEYNPRLDIKNNKDEIPYDLFTDEMKVKYGIDKLIIGKGN